MEDSDAETTSTIRRGYLPDGIGGDVTDLEAANKRSFLVNIDMATNKRCAFEPETFLCDSKPSITTSYDLAADEVATGLNEFRLRNGPQLAIGKASFRKS